MNGLKLLTNHPSRFIAPLVILVVFGFGSGVYAQCPSPNSQNFYEAQMGESIANLQAQGATVDCVVNGNILNISVSMPGTTLYTNTTISGYNSTTFIFDPLTGRTTNVFISDSYNGPPHMIIVDSVLGIINGTDGWFSVFYPMGNPYSAAIQNPLEVLMHGFVDFGSGGSPGHPPPPMQGPGGIQ